MKTVTLSATFDGKQIRLEEDCALPTNARLLVTVLPPAAADSEDEFRRGWYGLAAESLAGAYGPDEPEYTLDMLKAATPPPPFFSSFVFPGFKPGKAKLEKKGGIHFRFLTQGGAPLAVGYYHVVPAGLGFGWLRSPKGQRHKVRLRSRPQLSG